MQVELEANYVSFFPIINKNRFKTQITLNNFFFNVKRDPCIELTLTLLTKFTQLWQMLLKILNFLSLPGLLLWFSLCVGWTSGSILYIAQGTGSLRVGGALYLISQAFYTVLVCLKASLRGYLSVCLSIYLPIFYLLSIIYVSIYISIYLPTYLPIFYYLCIYHLSTIHLSSIIIYYPSLLSFSLSPSPSL